VRGDYSDVIVNISRVYSAIRGDTSKAITKGDAQNFLRKTTKYWVRPEFVTAIK
jgi:SPX domain protein involved in polyphosphate accumulation